MGETFGTIEIGLFTQPLFKMNSVLFYKRWINIIPFFRGFFFSFLHKSIRQNIMIGKKMRIKRGVEWRLFPHCVLSIGDDVIIGKDVTINVAPEASLTIGNKVGLGNRCQIVSHKNITIGEGAILAPGVMIFDHNHVFDTIKGVKQREFDNKEISIGSHSWLGAGCIILKGVHIGDNCVIGAGSVVTKDIPSGSIAVGIPAKVINK